MTVLASAAPRARLSVASKLYIACEKTLSNRSNAIILGTVAAGAALSSSFRYGLYTSPIGIGSSLVVTLAAGSALGQRVLSKLPIPNLPNKIAAFSRRILPESDLTSTVIGPVIEEVIFRGAIQSASVAALGPIPGIALSALAFSAVHAGPRVPSQVVNSLVGGIVLGILAEKVSLLASIGHHVGVNAFWGPVLGFFSDDKGFLRNYMEAERILPSQ
ncbi:MAG TPA: CPBP family intramembrane glutamic endopeptidase [Chlamydiales bacterium]|nr:CPBP family intramembrane glutamic endopeptidase [Chlamydiales bacterium]